MEESSDSETTVKNESLKSWRTQIAAMAALLHIVGLGMVSAFTASASVDMRKPGSRFSSLTSNQVVWIASLPSITAIFGNLLAGYLSLNVGRKAVLMYASGPFLVSWLMIAYAPSIIWIYIGRLLAGFSTGMCSVAVPAYVIEIATINVRGLLGSCFQISFSLGVLIAMTFVMFVRWSWLAIVGAFFVTYAVFFTYFIPESPSWLLAQGKNSEALESWRFLRGKSVLPLSEHMKMESQVPRKSVSFHEFRKPELYKPIALSIGLVFFQQFSGISALMSYTVEIFERAESSVDPSIAAAIVAGVQVIATVIAGVLVDKVGRTLLYVISGIFVTVGLIILGIYGIVSRKYVLTGPVYGSIPLIGFIIFVASFSLGYGPIPYLMTPEFVPLHSRSAVLSIAGVFSSLFLFIVTKTFDDLRFFVSDYGVYWVYGFFSLLGCLFCWLCFPETKHKSVIQIQQSFRSNLESQNSDEVPINN